jgi:magnesium chelatase subunit I
MFPFAAIVGQEKMKKALLLNVVDPGIGGVLIKGEKGTAKSTTVRALEQVLPKRTVIKGCPFGCDPAYPERYCPYCAEKYGNGKEAPETIQVPMTVQELPLSATEDRIAGTLDLESVLKTGKKRFEPGILAGANGNILYVDEINLLEDYIVDMLLDSAAMGVNYVEREGVSFTHPARFVLVGSMNPEEGELRPQLLDRFGMSVEVAGEKDLGIRADVVARRLEFDNDPAGFTAKYADETKKIADKIVCARQLLPNVKADRKIIEGAAYVSLYFHMEGHRADITMIRSARANAAYEGRTEVTKEDLEEVAPLVLAHRLKNKPFDRTPEFDLDDVHKCLQDL